MSLDLVELSTLKVSFEEHAWLKAKAQVEKIHVNELVRQIIHDRYQKELSVFSIADEFCKSQGLPGIGGGFK